jgi:hypothetical protein
MKQHKFAWRVLCETNDERIAFPSILADEPVSDEEIKRYLDKFVSREKIHDEADDIYHLVFIAIDENDKDRILEPLSPFDFWPNKAYTIGIGNSDNFRTSKGGEK